MEASSGSGEKRFARVVLAIGIAVSVFQVIYTLHWNQPVPDRQVQNSQIVVGVIPAAAALLLLITWKLKPSVQFFAAVIVITGLLVLYAAEIYSEGARVAPGTAALRAGRTWDSRNLYDVTEDLQQQGVEAVPVIAPAVICRLDPSGAASQGKDLMPLGAISNKWTILGNETGTYAMYQSDEHGFNNPKGMWIANPLDVAVIGDSFAQGDFVPPEQNLVAHLRTRYPAALNLGMSGNGPLFELAGTEEYLPALRPKIVLWLFYENDFADLAREAEIPALLRYLQPGFRQGLLEQQDQIDRQLEQVEAEVEQATKRWPKQWPSGLASIGLTRRTTPLWMQDMVMGESATSLVRIFGLQSFRNTLVYGWAYSKKAPKHDEMLVKVLGQAQTTVASWGGKLYFVYVPSYGILKGKGKEVVPIRTRVLDLARSLGIPTIDLYQTFQKQANPLALFPYPYSHYNEDGYRVAAQGILDSLAAQ